MNQKKIAIAALILLPTLFLSKGPIAAPNTHFKFAPPSPWQKTKMNGVDAGWLIPGDFSNPSLTVSSDINDDFMDPKEMDEKILIPKIESTRAIPYHLFGINDWKIEKHQISSYAESLVLEIEGHYHSPAGPLVHFVERDYFLGFNSYTVIFSEEENTEGSVFKTHDQIESWLNRFKAEANTQGTHG